MPKKLTLIKSFSYLLFAVPAIPLTVWMLDYIGRHSEFHTWLYQGDIDASVLILAISSISYVAGNFILFNSREPDRRSIYRQHFDQSLASYLVSAASLAVLVANYPDSAGSLGYGLLAITFTATAWGIPINFFYILLINFGKDRYDL